MTSITIEGLDKLERKLGRLDAIAALQEPMHKATKRIYAETQNYPPPPPGSKYVRKHSGGLAGSWVERVSVRRQTLVGIVGTDISYGPFVMHPTKQAWMHKGRWPTTDDIVDKQKRAIMADFETAIRRTIDE